MKKQKKKLLPVPENVSVHWRSLHQDSGWTWRQIASERKRGYNKYHKSTICRHMVLPISDKADKRKGNKNAGRKSKLTERDKRNIVRQVSVLRSRGEVNFTVKRIKSMAGLTHKVCDESVRLVLHKEELKYLNTARKGILKKSDLKKRVEYAHRVKKKFEKLGPSQFFKHGIAFYLDGVSFTHKYNPMDQARAPKKKLWRKKSERLAPGLTTKSNNIGVGGKQAHFLVAVAYKKGVILCEQYHGRMTGKLFADFVRESLPEVFSKSANPKGRYFLQDGDPSQNSGVANAALLKIGAYPFSIPPRSPDLNPIENLFNLVRKALADDAVTRKIEAESWEQFIKRIEETLMGFDKGVIDKTIETMEKRLDLIIKNKGERTKY